MRALALAALLALAACAAPAPAPVATALEPGSTWRLSTLAGAPFPARATLTVGALEAFGQGPCNAWSAPLLAGSDGGHALGAVTATEMACTDLRFEEPYLAALAGAPRVEQAGDLLTVWAADGTVLSFTR